MSIWLKAGTSLRNDKKRKKQTRKVPPKQTTSARIDSLLPTRSLDASKLKQTHLLQFFQKKRKKKKASKGMGNTTKNVCQWNTEDDFATLESPMITNKKSPNNTKSVIFPERRISVPLNSHQEELLFGTDDFDYAISYELCAPNNQATCPKTSNQPIKMQTEKLIILSDVEEDFSPTVITKDLPPLKRQNGLSAYQSEDLSVFSDENRELSPTVTIPRKDQCQSRQSSDQTKCGTEEFTPLSDVSDLSPPITKSRKQLPTSETEFQGKESEVNTLDLAQIVTLSTKVQKPNTFTKEESCRGGNYINEISESDKRLLENTENEDSENEDSDTHKSQPIVNMKKTYSAKSVLDSNNHKGFTYNNIEAILHEESMNTNLDPPCTDSLYDPTYDSQTDTLFALQSTVNKSKSISSQIHETPEACPPKIAKTCNGSLFSIEDCRGRVEDKKKKLSIASLKRQIKFVPSENCAFVKQQKKKRSINQHLDSGCSYAFTCYSPTQNLSPDKTSLLRVNNGPVNNASELCEGIPETMLFVGSKDGFWDH